MEPVVARRDKRGQLTPVELRNVVNAIRYLARTACQWQYLPHDFPPWDVVANYYYKWLKDGVWDKANELLRERLRVAAGRDAQPSAAIIDSYSVKTTEVRGEHGCDAGKKVTGRKRHLLVDTLGMILAVVVHAACIQNRDGASWLMTKELQRDVSPDGVGMG